MSQRLLRSSHGPFPLDFALPAAISSLSEAFGARAQGLRRGAVQGVGVRCEEEAQGQAAQPHSAEDEPLQGTEPPPLSSPSQVVLPPEPEDDLSA